MERITNNDIHITRHPVDGFTLSYISDSNKYFKQRYIGYSIREAKKRFKNYIKEEEAKKCF
jgi:hypothetical protein